MALVAAAHIRNEVGNGLLCMSAIPGAADLSLTEGEE